ncbi:hypothetical protein [Tenacibaculum finnmarkense]|uniref:hypothetical protein n=1 Tax=Tenacibaculum finnmarkense TaxID=2781243 RepID=UPI001E657634|nr:hypothetical protein [Tenacibaculum finnmarkense]MCD8403327.1 hypothetical protein [Tenacibaculum finnmarkense genomovar finnmarkense]
MSLINALYILIAIFIFVIILIWCYLFLFVTIKKKRGKEDIVFEKKILEGIIATYSKVEIEESNKQLKKFKKVINKDIKYLFRAATIFIKFNRIVKFSNLQNFKVIFDYLEMSSVLNQKINNESWYVKAKAIWLSYEFELSENIKTINKYRNDKNTLVRREAQIALVSFLGWKSLAFFPYVKPYISLWQQIRIIEKLEEKPHEFDDIYIQKALASENKTVIELLIRIIKKFKLRKYKYYVIEQIFSDDTRLVTIAINTLKYLSSIGKEESVENLFYKTLERNQYATILNDLKVTIPKN